MRLQTWHDWTAETVTDERGNYMTYIDLEFEGEDVRMINKFIHNVENETHFKFRIISGGKSR